MLDSIRMLDDSPVSNQYLITREDRVADQQRRLLIGEARKRAKSYVAEALQDAEAIRAEAFQQGYSKGVLQVAGDLSDLLLSSRTLATALHLDLMKAARELLGDVLMDEELLDRLLQRYHTGWCAKGTAQLQVILPLRCKSEKKSLKNTLSERGVENVDIQFHAEERYLFRLADQVLELDIEATRTRLSPLLISQLKHLPEQARQLDKDAQDFFIQWCKQLTANQAGLIETEALDEHP